MSQRVPGLLGVRAREENGEPCLTDSDDDYIVTNRRVKVRWTFTSRNSTSNIGQQTYEETRREEDAHNEEAEGEQDHHQSEQEAEEVRQSEGEEECQGDDDDDDQEDVDDMNAKKELNNRPLNVGDREGCSSTSASREGCNVVITLTDSGLLDCPICFEPLTIPVYQCDQNGHIACSLCFTKINNKCPFCLCSIGSNRCRAIEKVVESSTTPCQNSKYGCNILVTYNKKNEHEKTCVCSPCSCPYFGCKFVSSAKDLYQHFSKDHPYSAVYFWLNDLDRDYFTFPIMLKKNDSFFVFRERHSGTLFVLYNRIESLGNVVTVSCIQPSFMDDFYYVLVVTNKESSLKFQSVTRNTPSLQVDGPSPTIFLLIPSEFFNSSGQVQITVSISSCIQ